MRTQTIAIYQFSELSESAKETARQWYRENALDFEWWDCLVEDWKNLADLIGIEIDKIYFSGFCSQGDGACFEGAYSYRQGWRKALKRELGDCPLRDELESYGERLQALQKPYFYGVSASVKHSGFYMHSGCTSISVDPGEHPTGYWDDITDLEDDVTQVLREFMDEIYQALEREFDYLNADNQVEEAIAANEWEFTENGDFY